MTALQSCDVVLGLYQWYQGFLNKRANSGTVLLTVVGTISDLILRLTVMTLSNLLYATD
jgi:hypothetical protein